MKKLLIALAILVVAGSVGLLLAVRVLGPRLVIASPPSGAPIGEYDFPRPETSLLALRIAVPVTLLDELASRELPERFEGGETRDFHQMIKGGAYTWDLTRGEVRFRNTGEGLAFAVPFEGKASIRGEIDAVVARIPLSGEADLAGVAGGVLAPEVQLDWGVNPNLEPSLELKKANVSLGRLGRVDVGELLGGGLDRLVQQQGRRLGPALRKGLNLRGEVSKLWNEAHLVRQVSEDPAVWVRVQPRRILVGAIDYGVAEELSLAVAIESETFLVNRAPAAPERAPLPPMSPLEGAAGTDLRLPVVVSMSELNELLAGEEFDIDTGVGAKIRVHGLAAEVGQGGFLNLRLELEADKSRVGRGVAGSIWVRGRPVIDYERQTLGFGEVELTVETRDQLTTAAAWLLEGILVKGLESQLRVDLNDYQHELDEEVQKAIAGSDLPEGLEVTMRNLAVRLADAYTITRHEEGGEADPGIVFVVRATGDLGTRINRLELKPSEP
jgi:hypothetical protein